jgi:L-fuculose-phosphate aldolase
MLTHETQLREEICLICKMMYERGYIGGPAGNVSARLTEEHVLITPSIAFKQFLKPEQILLVDFNGNKKDTSNEAALNLKPTSELFMHLEIYRQRADINGVAHAHPSYCVALTSAGVPMDTQVLTEGMIFLGAVPTAEFGTPTTQELVDSISELVKTHDAVLLPHHGALTLGKTLLDAYARMEVLEQVAQVQHLVEQLGGLKRLSIAQLQKILSVRKKMGMALPSDDELLTS